MLETTRAIELSDRELDLVSSALETQSKMLTIQAKAGDDAARKRLNWVKRTLVTLEGQRAPDPCAKPARFGWFGLRRVGGCQA